VEKQMIQDFNDDEGFGQQFTEKFIDTKPAQPSFKAELPSLSQPVASLADLEAEDCVHADSFDLGKHYCKAQSKSKSSTSSQSASNQKSFESQSQEIKQGT
jgi:hypothetical protein